MYGIVAACLRAAGNRCKKTLFCEGKKMKRTRFLTILVVAVGLAVCSLQTVEAGPIGTAFTYQGRLMDNEDVADGLYDFLIHRASLSSTYKP